MTNGSKQPSSNTARRAGFWRRPGAAAIAIAVVCVPLILLLGEAGVLVGMAGLCLYPILDVPRILARPSWWRGAAVSVLSWIGLFIAIMGATESVRPLGEDAMAFLLPFMLYPVALATSGVVRLSRRLAARPGASSPRAGGIVVVIVCGLFLVVPMTLNTIPAITQAITGNSPPNFSYWSEGEVRSASPEQVTARLDHGPTEGFRLGADTEFKFQGPGSRMVEGEPGPAWLKTGQRVGLHYVYRNRLAHLQLVTIWIERKGCTANAKWIAAMQALGTSSPPAASLTGTRWGGLTGPDRPEGDEITGEWWDEMGEQTVWSARRKRDPLSGTAPKPQS